MYEYVLYKKELKDEYLEVFDKAELYVDVNNYTETDNNEALNNLLDILLTAQNEGTPVNKIVGNDMERFCKSYFSEQNTKTRLISYAQVLYRFSIWVVVIESLILLSMIGEPEFSDIWAIRTDISGYIVGAGIAFLCFGLLSLIVKPLVFKSKKFTASKMENISIILLIICMVSSIAILTIFDIECELPLLPVLITASVYSSVYFAVRSVIRYHSYGSIRKKKGEGELSIPSFFKECAKEGAKEGALEGDAIYITRRYKKMKKKILKKEPNCSEEEIIARLTEKEEKSFLFEKKIHNFFLKAVWLFPLVCAGIQMLIEPFEGFIDVLVYFAIMYFIALVMLRPYGKFLGKLTDTRIEFFATAKEKGLNVVEYANMINEMTGKK